ncbi:glycosyltransferase [Crocosphaera sp. UHCC 0190]|uniref:glycosyltransferase n=1 Tax=Crocosphaera sp. UHCC 0190 TaxID=3110246 RepID=UPI002B21173D|nr:glycosyltransferase [Crocosphaera sp. UHCC 0190]MEA5510649.1 glycosyltransferase [Crocosphaera sp. UHCC 0190]
MSNPDHYSFVFLEIFSQEGGIQAYVKDILQAYLSLIKQSSKLAKTDIFLLRDSPDCHNPFSTELINFHYLKTLPPWKGRIKLAYTLLIHLIQKRPKKVFCGHINLAPLIQFFCQPLGIPYTVLTYGKEVWKPLPPQQQKALQNAEAIWTISRYSRDCLCQANNIDPKTVEILPCIVDGNQFTPGKKPIELIEKYDLKDAKILMTVARLWSGDIYKGVDVTIRALPKILQSFPNIRYLIIGRGDDRPRLEQLTKALGVGDRVIFAGFVPNEDLANHYRVADAYIMPSQEGFGIVYLEAMACGIPVLSGDADGSADPLQDGKLGWRVPHRDSDAVAQGCLEILQGNDQRCHGEWLRQETLDQFSPEALSQKLAQLL